MTTASADTTPTRTGEEDTDTQVRPWQLHIPDADLDDLRRRLLATRWPDRETVDDTSQGPQLAKVRALVDHWATSYDWRPTEQMLNNLGQYETVIDGLPIRFLHVKSPHANATPMIMTHGWPGSVLEFRAMIPALTDPAAHGGSPDDAFHLVIPSLPGFGFSGRPTEPGWDVERTARAWITLMHRLGYRSWVAQGGDIGAAVTEQMAAMTRNEDTGLAAIHLNMAMFTPTETEQAQADERERVMLDEADYYQQALSAYAMQQATRPQTIGYGLSDSPVALASWMYAMFQDVGGARGDAEAVFSHDDILNDITVYWLTNTAASSARMYWEMARSRWTPPASLKSPITIPSGITIMPAEYVRKSRRWVEPRYTDLRLFHEAENGGHFAAMEQPDMLVDDIRATFRDVTTSQDSAAVREQTNADTSG